MNAIIAILNIIVILSLALAFVRKYNFYSYKLYFIAFCVHIIAGLLVGYLYAHYYSAGDTWLFFADAKRLANLAHTDFSGYLDFLWKTSSDTNLLEELFTAVPRSLIFVKGISVLCLLTNDNYWICSLYLSFFSFVAAWYLFVKINHLFPNAIIASSLSFLFFPSVVLWSSGIEKETIALSALYIVSATFICIIKNERISILEWLITFSCLLIAWALKYYWMAVFLPVVMTSLFTWALMNRYPSTRKMILIYWPLIFTILILVVTATHPNFHLDNFFDVIIMNNRDFLAISRTDGAIHYYDLQATWSSMVINSPWALFSGLLRPFIWEAHGIIGILASLENTLILTLIISAIFGAIKRKGLSSLILISVVVYSIILCIFLSLSTPNFGTLSRYRTGFLPFLIFILAYRNPLLHFLRKPLGVFSK